jgi:hypothetical protein
VFHNLKKNLKEYGIAVPAENEGDISGAGIAGYYKWNEEKNTLTVEVTSKPWFLPCELIYSKINDAIHHLHDLYEK